MLSHSGLGLRKSSVRRLSAAIPWIALFLAIAPLHGQRAASSTQTLRGEIQLMQSRAITASRIVIEDLRLLTNGFGLELTADVIEVRGSARILAFDSSMAKKAPGEPGKSAGLVQLNARRLIGSPIAIDNSGEDGANGSPGQPGGPGAIGASGTPRNWQPWSGCSGGKDGDHGGPGGRGGDGGPGGPGGNGGVVLLELQLGGGPTTTEAVAHGGRGGKGGVGGVGGPGGAGGPGGPPVAICGVTAPGQPGINGAGGEPGKDGSDGTPGQIIDLLKRKSQRPPLKRNQAAS